MSMAVADSALDLARIQFATTSLYHFLFVPLTLGLAPLVQGWTCYVFRARLGGDAVAAPQPGGTPTA